MTSSIGLSLLGAGNIGLAVVGAIQHAGERYAARVGAPLEIRRVLVRDTSRPRPGVDPAQVTDSIDDVLGDEATQIVIEFMGGEEPARTYIEAALKSGRHVVTANKEVMAKHGAGLLQLAYDHGVRLLYEASVGGGIPVIAPLSRDLLANEVTAVTAIINGTTNYMLTAMTQQGAGYEDVLAEAQRLGYAEPDPTADVEGIDAAYKIAVLCGLAFNVDVSPNEVDRRGISTITARDIAYAAQLGYVIKLLARARVVEGEIEATVRPTLVGAMEPLAKVDGVLNAVQFEGDLVGRVMFEGPGAGQGPTASSILADVLDVAQDVAQERKPLAFIPRQKLRVRPAEEHAARAYIRVGVKDQPGVLAAIATALGTEGVSISSVLQYDPEFTGGDEGTAELVLTTHSAPGRAFNAALDVIRELDVVLEIGNVLPMEG
ncbi:MAG: homoserine dehydrogenase [Dehalococcoidia bacterium]|nr:homoserine dehydrogenase [Dehalococcoidia bacterium]MCB9483177.1 homoserine dehydrogenase [Dehalococcoidia bacterium]